MWCRDFFTNSCGIIVVWLVEWQSHFAYGHKWISSCNFCIYLVICIKFTADLHALLLSSFTFCENWVHWEPFFSQECKCNSVLVFCIFQPFWIKCYIEDLHVMLFSICELCENWWIERHALFMVLLLYFSSNVDKIWCRKYGQNWIQQLWALLELVQ